MKPFLIINIMALICVVLLHCFIFIIGADTSEYYKMYIVTPIMVSGAIVIAYLSIYCQEKL